MQVLPPILQGQQAGPAGPKKQPQGIATPAAGAGPGVKLIGGPEQAPYVVYPGHFVIPLTL